MAEVTKIEDRERARALLESQHVFPGDYTFRVVTKPDERTGVITAVRASLRPGSEIVDVGERESRGGKWVSIHVKVLVVDANEVLDIYGLLHTLDAVVMTL